MPPFASFASIDKSAHFPHSLHCSTAQGKMSSAGSVTCVVEVGDLVLFDRRCAPMGPFGASICYGAKALTMTPWDHVGVVVQREDGELCVLDANFSGELHAMCNLSALCCVKFMCAERTRAFRAMQQPCNDSNDRWMIF